VSEIDLHLDLGLSGPALDRRAPKDIGTRHKARNNGNL
jgi:hypothetical protein